MTARDAAFLGCRLMSVWLAIYGFIAFPGAIANQLYFAEHPELNISMKTMSEKLFLFAPTISICLQLVFSLILFYGAKTFSGWLVEDPDANGSAPTPKSLLSVGALLIGLYMAAEFLPNLTVNLYNRVTGSLSEPGSNPSVIVANLVGIAMAIGLIVAAIVWAKRPSSARRHDPD